MIKKIKKIFWKIVLFFNTVFINIAISLYNTEQELLKPNSLDVDEKDKKNHRMLHRNPVLEKFYQGQTDKKYVKEYYEILKKADLFIKKSDYTKYGATADKHGMSYGKKDKWGRRYEHYGFFDPKSKNYGKTLQEVIDEERENRRTKDDNYEIINICNNQKIVGGLNDTFDLLKENNNGEFVLSNVLDQIQNDKFPVKILRNDDEVINKIELLTDFVHVKRIDDEHRQLEFFVNLKFGTDKYDDDSQVIKDLININNVWTYNDYGELNSYKVLNYKKRIKYNDTHEVFKFFCKEMSVINN